MCQSEPYMTTAISYMAARMQIYQFIEWHQRWKRWATNYAKVLPKIEQLIADFVRYINDKVKMLGIDNSSVVNFDQININY